MELSTSIPIPSDSPDRDMILMEISVKYITSTASSTENGMEMELSFRLSDHYIQKLDYLFSLEEIEECHNRMILDYTKRMQILKQNAALSRPISECINYIYAHIKERITIEDLADFTGNSASYISRLFKS